MRVKLLILCFSPSLGGFDDRPLAEFVRDKEVIAVREHFFVVHELPHLACLITYQEARGTALPARVTPVSAAPKAVTEDVAPADRPLFTTLREWRNAQARRDGVPPYVILTNRELLRVVQARPESRAALGALEGLGPGKVERYGQALLEQLHGATAAASTTSGGAS